MRVLQLAPVWETVPPPAYGGTETVVSVLTEALARRGIDVTLAASGDSTSSAPIVSVCPQSLRVAGLHEDAVQYAIMHTVHALKDADRYDIIHYHNGPPSEFGMALSHLVRVPMLATLHNNLHPATQFIWQRYEGWYNTISHHQHRTMPCMPRAKFAGVVYNAIDVESFPFQAEKQEYVLFIGRMDACKGAHLAIEAARRAGIQIKLAGKISAESEREYFYNVVEPLIDGEQAIFLGEADGQMKRDLYAGARALLVPIQWDEPFGLVMIEAMACGTPVIVFPRGAAPEIVVDGETGFHVQDVNAMAEAVRVCDRIDPLACRRHVEQRFGPEALADAYLETYERVIWADRKGFARLD